MKTGVEKSTPVFLYWVLTIENLNLYLEKMKDGISKKKGLPFSTSRKEEKKNKRNTHKARRQDGKKACAVNI